MSKHEIIYEDKINTIFVEGSFAHGRPTYIHPEDGQPTIDYSAEETFHLFLTTQYGYLWVHHKTFPTEAGALAFMRKVEAAIAAGEAVNLGLYWHCVRVIYGTQAYLDEEPMIVAREKDDALWNDYFGR